MGLFDCLCGTPQTTGVIYGPLPGTARRDSGRGIPGVGVMALPADSASTGGLGRSESPPRRSPHERDSVPASSTHREAPPPSYNSAVEGTLRTAIASYESNRRDDVDAFLGTIEPPIRRLASSDTPIASGLLQRLYQEVSDIQMLALSESEVSEELVDSPRLYTCSILLGLLDAERSRIAEQDGRARASTPGTEDAELEAIEAEHADAVAAANATLAGIETRYTDVGPETRLNAATITRDVATIQAQLETISTERGSLTAVLRIVGLILTVNNRADASVTSSVAEIQRAAQAHIAEIDAADEREELEAGSVVLEAELLSDPVVAYGELAATSIAQVRDTDRTFHDTPLIVIDSLMAQLTTFRDMRDVCNQVNHILHRIAQVAIATGNNERAAIIINQLRGIRADNPLDCGAPVNLAILRASQELVGAGDVQQRLLGFYEQIERIIESVDGENAATAELVRLEAAYAVFIAEADALDGAEMAPEAKFERLQVLSRQLAQLDYEYRQCTTPYITSPIIYCLRIQANMDRVGRVQGRADVALNRARTALAIAATTSHKELLVSQFSEGYNATGKSACGGIAAMALAMDSKGSLNTEDGSLETALTTGIHSYLHTVSELQRTRVVRGHESIPNDNTLAHLFRNAPRGPQLNLGDTSARTPENLQAPLRNLLERAQHTRPVKAAGLVLTVPSQTATKNLFISLKVNGDGVVEIFFNRFNGVKLQRPIGGGIPIADFEAAIAPEGVLNTAILAKFPEDGRLETRSLHAAPGFTRAVQCNDHLSAETELDPLLRIMYEDPPTGAEARARAASDGLVATVERHTITSQVVPAALADEVVPGENPFIIGRTPAFTLDAQFELLEAQVGPSAGDSAGALTRIGGLFSMVNITRTEGGLRYAFFDSHGSHSVTRTVGRADQGPGAFYATFDSRARFVEFFQMYFRSSFVVGAAVEGSDIAQQGGANQIDVIPLRLKADVDVPATQAAYTEYVRANEAAYPGPVPGLRRAAPRSAPRSRGERRTGKSGGAGSGTRSTASATQTPTQICGLDESTLARGRGLLSASDGHRAHEGLILITRAADLASKEHTPKELKDLQDSVASYTGKRVDGRSNPGALYTAILQTIVNAGARGDAACQFLGEQMNPPNKTIQRDMARQMAEIQKEFTLLARIQIIAAQLR